jgi:hypothetical protein
MFYSPVTEVATRTGLVFPDASFVFASTELTTKIRAVLCCDVQLERPHFRDEGWM